MLLLGRMYRFFLKPLPLPPRVLCKQSPYLPSHNMSMKMSALKDTDSHAIEHKERAPELNPGCD